MRPSGADARVSSLPAFVAERAFAAEQAFVAERAFVADADYPDAMCRSIHPLFNFEPPATDDEVHAAALQFVRKVSGSSKPSQANEEAFQRAVDEIADATHRLIDGMTTHAPPRDRDVMAARARVRAAARYGGIAAG